MPTPNHQRRRITVELLTAEAILLDELVQAEDWVLGTRSDGRGNVGRTVRRAIRVLAVQQLGKRKVEALVGGMGLRGPDHGEGVPL